MHCDLEKIPSVGLFGMLVHLSGQRARKMFEKYDLNKSQASILFYAASWTGTFPKRTGQTVECDSTFHHFSNPRWKKPIYQKVSG